MILCVEDVYYISIDVSMKVCDCVCMDLRADRFALCQCMGGDMLHVGKHLVRSTKATNTVGMTRMVAV